MLEVDDAKHQLHINKIEYIPKDISKIFNSKR